MHPKQLDKSKTSDTSIIFPLFSFTDVFCTNSLSLGSSTLFELNMHLRDKVLKFSFKLSEKVLQPSNHEKQNVVYVPQVFNNMFIKHCYY